jgi:small subunit ribosomal protein S18
MNNNNRNHNQREQAPVKKVCYFTANKITTVDYKDLQTLRRFMSPHAKILPRKRTGLSPKYQRMVATALKRARHMALLPFVSEY